MRKPQIEITIRTEIDNLLARSGKQFASGAFEFMHLFPLVPVFGVPSSFRKYVGSNLLDGFPGLSKRDDPCNSSISVGIASVDRRLPAPLVKQKAHSHKLTGVRARSVRSTIKGRSNEPNDLQAYRCG